MRSHDFPSEVNLRLRVGRRGSLRIRFVRVNGPNSEPLDMNPATRSPKFRADN